MWQFWQPVWRPRMPGQKGLRVLCIDGGGTRGVLTIALMKAICKACGGAEIHDYFDVICGTSTGAWCTLGVRQISFSLTSKILTMDLYRGSFEIEPN